MPLPTITASLGYIAITYDIRVPGKYLYLVIVLGIESGFFFCLGVGFVKIGKQRVLAIVCHWI